MGSQRMISAFLVLGCACGPTVAASDSGTDEGTLGTSGSPDSLDTGSTVATTVELTTAGSTSTSGAATTIEPDTGTDESTGAPTRSDPTHLLIIRTPHGVFEEHVWSGSGERFVLGPVLAPLLPWADSLVLVDGLENVILTPGGAEVTNAYGVTSSSILTGGLLGSIAEPPEPPFYFGGGPSLDVVLGGQLGAGTAHPHVHLGVSATDGVWPTGVSYMAADEPLPPFDSPALAFEALFAGLDDPLLDELADQLALPLKGPGDVLEAQLSIAHAAIALDVSRVLLLSIDRGLPGIIWTELGVNQSYHDVIAENDPAPVQIVQTFWAERIAALLARLQATRVGNGHLLERTVILWISAEGSPPAAYSTHDVFALIIDASGTFATGRIVEITADQADFAVTIAAGMGVALPTFGHADLEASVIDELLAR